MNDKIYYISLLFDRIYRSRDFYILEVQIFSKIEDYIRFILKNRIEFFARTM